MKRSIFLRLMAVLFCLMIPFSALADGAVSMEAAIGYDGVATYVRKLPLTVTITNQGPDLQGTLAVNLVRSDTAYDRYEMPVTVASGATIQVSMPLVLTRKQKNYAVQLLQGDTVMAEASFAPRNMLNPFGLIVGAITPNPSDLQSMAITQGNDALSRQEYWNVVPLSLDQFPEDGESLRFFDILAIDGVDLTTLSEKQQAAFDQWLKDGGIVIVGGGASGAENLRFFQPYTGISAGAVTKETDISGRLMAQLGISGEGLGENVILTELVGTSDELLNASRVGDGYVITAAFSLTENPLGRWLGSKAIWQRVLLAYAQNAYRNLVNLRMHGNYDTQQVYISQSLNGSIGVPGGEGVFWPLVLLAVFLLLAGVGGYWILKKLDKRDWLWLAVPVLAVATSLAMWGLSGVLSIRQPVAVRYSVVTVDKDGTTDGYTAISVTKAEREPVTVSLTGGGIDMASTASYSYSQDNSGEQREGNQLRYVYRFGETDSITMQQEKAWQMNSLLARNVPMADVSGITGRCDWEGDQLVFTVLNGSGVALQEGAILSGYGFVSVPALLPGETARCVLRPMTDDEKARQSGSYQQPKDGVMLPESMRRDYSGYDLCYELSSAFLSAKQKEKQGDSDALSHWSLCFELMTRGENTDLNQTIQYVAFCDQLDQLTILLDGKPVQRQAQMSCIKTNLHYNPIADDGTARFLSGSFPLSSASQTGNEKPVVGEPLNQSNYQSFYLATSPMFAFDISTLPPNLNITALRVYPAYSYFSYEISFYNGQTGQWDVINRYRMDGGSNPGQWEMNTLPKLEPYMQDGYLYVRFDKYGNANDYSEISNPRLDMEGRMD